MPLKAYKYSYTMPRGKKRFIAYSHGKNWNEAQANIRRFYPKRSNVKSIGTPILI